MRSPESFDPILLAEFGRRVAERRKVIDPDLKRFSGAIGMDRTYWRRIEGGLQNVSLSTLARVADALDISIAKLVEGLEGHRQAERSLVSEQVSRSAGPAD